MPNNKKIMLRFSVISFALENRYLNHYTIHQRIGYCQRVLVFVSPKPQRQRHFRQHMHCSGVQTGFSRTAENRTVKVTYWFTSLCFSFARKKILTLMQFISNWRAAPSLGNHIPQTAGQLKSQPLPMRGSRLPTATDVRSPQNETSCSSQTTTVERGNSE